MHSCSGPSESAYSIFFIPYVLMKVNKMDVDQQLQEQSKVLLQKLKARQGRLQNIVGYQDSIELYKTSRFFESEKKNREKPDVPITTVKNTERILSHEHEDDNAAQLDVSTVAVQHTRPKSLAQSHLSSSSQTSMTSVKQKNEINRNGVNHKECTPSNNIQVKETKDRTKESDNQSDLFGQPAKDHGKWSRTPVVVRQNRNIIDKNVKVKYDLNVSEVDDRSRLNFSYSKFDDSDLNSVKLKLDDSRKEGEEENALDNQRAEEEPVPDLNYKHHLQSAGNDRKVANFIRETRKPKSILLASGPKTLKKSMNKVSFLGSHNSSSGMSSLNDQRQLLGYDWIAALLDNDRGVMNESEGYFEELKEFRRINRDECVNNYFMEGADTLLEERDREPSPIAEALSDTRVKPYTVNGRLFTEPLKQRIFEWDDTSDDRGSEKIPTQEEPRFVRVSIPRSTLLSPQRVRPHRRKSLDDTDSFALSTHCVKGYENSIPSMVPAASNIGLRDASVGLKSKMQTTLADAEKVAASFPYPWMSSASSNMRQTTRTRDESALYRSYQDMTLPSALQFCGRGDMEESGNLKQATEDLLNSTYSLMYEMKKIKQQRDTFNSRQLGHVA